MSKRLLTTLALTVFSLSLYAADAAPKAPGAPAPGPSTLPPLPPLEQKAKAKPAPEYKPTKPVEKKFVRGTPTYFHPGILILKDGNWNGGDYLFNLSNQIGVNISILKPENSEIRLNEDAILKKIEGTFKSGGISPNTLMEEGQPPVPFFYVQILIYPAGNVIAAATKGALYESVTLKRANLEGNTAFQAVTWERESLIVSPPENFEEQLLSNVMETVDAFVDRFQFYQQFKK